MAVVRAGHVDGDFDRAASMLPNETNHVVQLGAGHGQQSCGAGVELHKGHRQGVGKLSQLVEVIAPEGHRGLRACGHGKGGDIEPVGSDQGHIGLALVETEGHEGVESLLGQMVHRPAVGGVDNVQSACHVKHLRQVEGYGAVGVSGVVVDGEGAGSIVAAVGRAGGEQQELLIGHKGDGGLVETAVALAPQVDRGAPVGPVANIVAGGGVDIAIAQTAGVGDEVEGLHVAAEERAALTVGAVDRQTQVDGFAPLAVVPGDEVEVRGQGRVAMEVGAGLLHIVPAGAVGGQQETAAVRRGGRADRRRRSRRR